MCNISANYYNATNGSCQYCDPTSNDFINITNFYTCEHCTLNQCLSCASLITCSMCNLGANFVLNLTT